MQYNGTSKWIYTYAFDLTKEATGITSLVPKQPFRAMDYNEVNETFAKPFIGQIISMSCSSSYVPEGTLPCDGTEYAQSQFYELWKNYLTSGKLPTCTYTEYSNAINTYGQCSKWAIDTTNNKFKVPTLLNKIVTGVTGKSTVLYDMTTTNNMQMRIPLNDSLGRLNMLFNGVNQSDNTEGLTGANVSTNYGQVQYTGTGYSTSNLPSGGTTGTVTPSKVNLDPNGTLYVNNSVQSIEVRYFVVVATGTINSSMMDWSNWASSLESKVSKDDLTEVQVVTETYQNGTSWYRIYSDGWCEQGGTITVATNISLLKSFKDTNYTVVTSASTMYTKSTTNLNITDLNFGVNNKPTICGWRACGYIK